MLTTLQVTTPPAQEPVSLDLARLHGRIDQTGDDLLLAGYIAAARIMAEAYLSRALITQTLAWTLVPQSPLRPSVQFLRGTLTLPRAPVQSIASVAVLDTRGNATTLAAATLPVVPPAELSGYIADVALSPARLTIGPATVLSDGRTLRETPLQHLQVSFVAGYGDTSQPVPQPIINAILLTTAFLYENRGDTGGELPQAAQWLLDPWRIMFVA